MFNLEPYINLPLVWGGIILIAVFLYVLLDGFDLGVGILFPFAPTETCREKIMKSVAPFWDGNETWLVFGGGGLFAAFPLAYAVILPAMYLPILIMLCALIFRGIAFEFRFKATRFFMKKVWNRCFHFGSLVAAFMQGNILGGLAQGIQVEGGSYATSTFKWLSPFSLMTGVAVVCGYVLLGATWIIMKTDNHTQEWARKTARYILFYILFFVAVAYLWLPVLDPEIKELWFSYPTGLYFLSIPLGFLMTISFLVYTLLKPFDHWPFFLSLMLFVWGFIGFIATFWPYIVPRSITFKQAAASPESQSIMLVGVVFILPIIFTYTGYSYYLFRGKVKDEDIY